MSTRPNNPSSHGCSLPPRQAQFVAEYVVDFNGAQAAMRAGYSKRTARIKASQLLARPEIKQAVEAQAQQKAEQRGLEADSVVERLSEIAFGDIRELFDETGRLKKVTELSRETAALIASVGVNRSGTTQVKLVSRLRALELLMRHLGLLQPAVELEPARGRSVQDQKRIERMSDADLAKADRLLAEFEALIAGVDEESSVAERG